MRIEIRLDPRRPWTWIRTLANSLQRRGDGVRLVAAPGEGRALGAGFDLLEQLESLIYRLPEGRPSRRLGLAAVQAGTGFDGEPDCVIDLAGGGTPSGVPVLVPFYDGCPDEGALLGALLDGRTPRLTVVRASDDRVLFSALPGIEQKTVALRALDEYFARLPAVLTKAVDALHGDAVAWAPDAAIAPVRAPGRAEAAGMVTSQLARKLSNRLLSLVRLGEHWRTGWRRPRDGGIMQTQHWPDQPFTWLKDDGARYFADPFAVEEGGRLFVFVEEFPYATGKGILSVFELDATGRPVRAPVPVLEESCHLSYPFVFRQGGTWYMIPETSGNRTISLYRAEDFPERWVRHAILVDEVEAADATLFGWDGRLWLAATTASDGSSSWDGLSLFHASSLEGDWIPHSANPVLIDVSCARPAGPVIQTGLDLRRPAQDCTDGYGRGLALCRVDTLTTDRFSQTVEARVAPPPSSGLHGAHTLGYAGGLEFVDAVGPRWRWG